jgi:AraC-like DNA-binding protein
MKYPWDLLPQLGRQIEMCRKREAHAALDSLLTVIAEHRGSLEFRKLRCATILIGCTRGSHRGGVPSEKILEGFYSVIERMTRLRTWNAVKREMHRYVDDCLSDVRPVRKTSTELAVARIRKELATLQSPLTLAQYAEKFGMSSGHLSRAFNAMAGRTFRDELRRCRIENACRLLTRTGLKISAVARQVGLQDTSQFIADFRREMGVTPGDYRKDRHRRHVVGKPLV